MPQVYLIGIGMGNPETLTLQAARLIEKSDCLIGAKRMVESVGDSDAKRFFSIKNDEITEIISKQPQDSIISVLLSGDVGFYSAAKKLTVSIREQLPEFSVECICGISSLQYLCAKIQTPWDDVTVVSVHGRQANVSAQVRKKGKVFVLTGSNQTANQICACLCRDGLSHAKVWVGEELSYPQEKISCGTAEQLSSQTFSHLAVMLIQVQPSVQRDYPALGLEDEEFLRNTQGKTVPMTKQEIRAVSMAKLKVTQDACIYDVGAGTGSVTVESALLAPGGRVFAIEKNPQAVQQLKENISHFLLTNVEIIQGTAPEALEALPPPDCVFIGGSSGKIEPILRLCFEKNPKARIVVTAITLETVADILEAVKQIPLPISLEISQVSAARARSLNTPSKQMHLMMGQNPVFICGIFPKDSSEQC